MIDGDLLKGEILLVDKPEGWTSFDVVAKIRGQMRANYRAQGIIPTKKQLRVGHAGTLDPFATGLLIILLQDGTKKAGDFLKLDKSYRATIMLGATSTTGDPEGETTAVSDVVPNREDIEAVLGRFRGEITQVPPAFSAIKINGQRAYKLARAGQKVDIPERKVTIYDIKIVDYNYPQLTIQTHVSSGTYIRTLSEDIGRQLGVGAYTQKLRRTEIGSFSLESAINPVFE